VFESPATNLSSISTGGTIQVFIKDLADGSVDLVSRDTTGLIVADTTAENPDVSNDGRYIVFESTATNLSSLPANGATQIYLKDMNDDSIDMITAGGAADSNRPAMSPAAQYIVFDSAAGFSGSNTTRSVYIYDPTAPTTIELVSVNDSGTQGDGASTNASVSDNGNYVAFESLATNLVAVDNNGVSDIFRRDRSASETLLVSTADGTPSANAASTGSSISSNGAYVAFESSASNLVAEGTLGFSDIFVRDLSTMPTVTIERINIPQSFIGEANNDSNNASISADGRYVSFDSAYDYDITDTNTIDDVYRSYNSTFQ
jgi:Tol biopolymer transport system component